MDYEKLLKLGFKVTEPITVSCCNRKEGSVAVNNGFYLLPEEIDTYNRLDEQGYQFEIMTMMSKWPVSWKSFKTKIGKERKYKCLLFSV